MPHLTLEYSGNVTASDNMAELFKQFHTVLSEIGKINLKNCKSRAAVANNYWVGDGENTGFVHLDVRFLEGRQAAVVRQIGDQLLALLKDWFADAAEGIDLQITVEIRDIRQADYFKYPAGTFTPQ